MNSRGRTHPEIFELYQIKNGRQTALFTSIGLISGKPCLIARPLLETKCEISGEDAS